MPAIFQICPDWKLADLEKMLADRGYLKMRPHTFI